MSGTRRGQAAPDRRCFLAAAAAVAGGALAGSTLGLWPQRAGAAGEDLQALLERAVAAGDVPFAVAMWGDAQGVEWSGAAGEARAGMPASLDTVFRVFSMTKAVGATAAMILIDRGELDPDATVESILPEFAELRVLDGFDGNTPRLRAPARKATVTHLATHTSGLAYEFWNADIARYLQATGHPSIISGTRQALNYPLAFDPGSRWGYGIGIDWLGLVVEEVSGQSIDAFCRQQIFQPLKMARTAFEPEGALAADLADVYARTPDGGFAVAELRPPPQPEVYGMGHALYSTAPDYMRFLRMFLNRGELDGARVLSPDAVTWMMANRIGDLRLPVMASAAPPVSADVELFPGVPKSHSFGFLRVEEDVPGMRSAGSQGWAGVANTHYWLDPRRDVAAVLMTQTLPFVDPRFMQLYAGFEKAVYAAKA